MLQVHKYDLSHAHRNKAAPKHQQSLYHTPTLCKLICISQASIYWYAGKLKSTHHSHMNMLSEFKRNAKNMRNAKELTNLHPKMSPDEAGARFQLWRVTLFFPFFLLLSKSRWWQPMPRDLSLSPWRSEVEVVPENSSVLAGDLLTLDSLKL